MYRLLISDLRIILDLLKHAHFYAVNDYYNMIKNCLNHHNFNMLAVAEKDNERLESTSILVNAEEEQFRGRERT